MLALEVWPLWTGRATKGRHSGEENCMSKGTEAGKCRARMSEQLTIGWGLGCGTREGAEAGWDQRVGRGGRQGFRVWECI